MGGRLEAQHTQENTENKKRKHEKEMYL